MKNTNLKLKVDKIVGYIFLGIGLICASSIIFIVLFILIKGVKPFIANYGTTANIKILKFLFGPSFIKGEYGVFGLIINTLVIVFFASLLALPLSVLTALFIVRISPKKIGHAMQIVVELLASIPSIIFGLFGMGVINPLVRDFALALNFQTAGGVSTLSVIIVLVMMITPTITTLSITSMRAVKEDLVKASLALGATKTQTNFKIIVGGAKSGIIAALILGIGRALGEATAVSMVCGGASNISLGIFSPTGTLTSAMLQGIYESSGLDYDVRFSVGIVLIIIIFVNSLLLNYLKKRICRYEK